MEITLSMFDYTNFAFAYGKPLAKGSIKSAHDDFIVDEILGFEPGGEGEHLYLFIEKRGLNTEELVKQLALQVNCSIKDISYAGIKDRQAVTRQWLSIHCPGKNIPDAGSWAGSGWKVLFSKRHLKKLKKGTLSANAFQLVLRDIEQGTDDIEHRLLQIKQYGVPNYFGAQRFGYDGNNLVKAAQLLFDGVKVKNRFLRGIYYSAARSYLFNLMLSERIRQHSWNKALHGDVMQLAGTNSLFALEILDDLITERVSSFDISPAAPLWGLGAELSSGEALGVQKTALKDYQKWCEGLELHKLERSWRALILQVNELAWEWKEGNLLLSFQLAAGSYATSVVRELMNLSSK